MGMLPMPADKARTGNSGDTEIIGASAYRGEQLNQSMFHTPRDLIQHRGLPHHENHSLQHPLCFGQVPPNAHNTQQLSLKVKGQPQSPGPSNLVQREVVCVDLSEPGEFRYPSQTFSNMFKFEKKGSIHMILNLTL